MADSEILSILNERSLRKGIMDFEILPICSIITQRIQNIQCLRFDQRLLATVAINLHIKVEKNIRISPVFRETLRYPEEQDPLLSLQPLFMKHLSTFNAPETNLFKLPNPDWELVAEAAQDALYEL